MHQALSATNTHLHFTAVIINKIAGICLRVKCQAKFHTDEKKKKEVSFYPKAPYLQIAPHTQRAILHKRG